tara:strand:- start:209 stop:430 length:222 start_codon:yes stop_codon:yes gene_type:complete
MNKESADLFCRIDREIKEWLDAKAIKEERTLGKTVERILRQKYDEQKKTQCEPEWKARKAPGINLRTRNSEAS